MGLILSHLWLLLQALLSLKEELARVQAIRHQALSMGNPSTGGDRIEKEEEEAAYARPSSDHPYASLPIWRLPAHALFFQADRQSAKELGKRLAGMTSESGRASGQLASVA